jgi:hypothetical protein
VYFCNFRLSSVHTEFFKEGLDCFTPLIKGLLRGITIPVIPGEPDILDGGDGVRTASSSEITNWLIL